jgi:hypothetical protein
MSDTPRTDEMCFEMDVTGSAASRECVHADDARQLEVELNEARKCLREAIEFIFDGKARDWSSVMQRWRKAAGMEDAE